MTLPVPLPRWAPTSAVSPDEFGIAQSMHRPVPFVGCQTMSADQADRVVYRQWLVETYASMSQAFDKAIMTLAGGALGISITFVHDLAPKPTHETWLATSWGCFAAALLVILASFIASQRAILRMIGSLDRDEEPARGQLTTVLNAVSAGALILGVICLVRFALYNI